MKTLNVVALALVLNCASVFCNGEWQMYKTKYNKMYQSESEETLRRNIYFNNKRLIQEHNQRESSFKMGINQFADMSEKEYINTLRSIAMVQKRNPEQVRSSKNLGAVPDSIDWRDYGLVTPVKDQGQCGSASSFAVTGAVEGQHAAATGNLVSLSEANIAYCTFPFGSCSGGLLAPDNDYKYIIDFNGQDGEGCYVQYDFSKCFNDTSCKAATISTYAFVTSGDENALKEDCGTYGPIATSIDASHASFQLYSSGIYSEPTCSTTQLDHSVLIVGYGTDNGVDYWLCKNSWGASWGEQGYIQMSRNKNNQCGIATQASWPTV